MSKYIGKLEKVGIGLEETLGSEANTINFWVPVMDPAHEDAHSYINDESGIGTLVDISEADQDQAIAEGGFSAHVGIDHIGLIFRSLLGTVSTSADTPEAGVNQHTFTLQEDAQHPTLTLGFSEPNEDKAFIRSLVQSVEFTFETGSHAEYSADFVSEPSVAPSSSYSPSFSDETKFRPQDITFKIAETQSKLSSANTKSIESLSITFDQSPELDHNLGSLTPQDFLNTIMSIEGSFDATYDGPGDYKDVFTNANTSRAMLIKLSNSGVTIGSSTNPNIEIELNEVYFTGFDRDVSMDSLVSQSVDFKAAYDESNSKFGEIRVENTTSNDVYAG